MIIQEQGKDDLTRAKMKAPIYIWVGFICVTIYFAWQAFDMTGTQFRTEVPVFGDAKNTILPLAGFSIFNLILAWFLPGFIMRRNKNLTGKFMGFVIRMALIGSVGIYGTVCAVAGHDGNITLPFTIFALLGYIRSFPRAESLGF